MGGNDSGQAEGAGNDRRVGLRAAAGGHQCQDHRGIQGCGVGRCEVLGHQDEGRVRGRNAGSRDAAEFGHDAGADIQDVGGALGHVAAQVVQHFGDGRAGFPDGPLC